MSYIYYFIAIDGIRNYLPEFALNEFLGMQIWQYIGIGLLLIFSLLSYLIFSWFFGHILLKIANKLPFKNLADKFIKPVAKPTSMLIVLTFLSFSIILLELPDWLNTGFSYFFKAAIPLSVTVIAYRLTNLVADLFSNLASKTKTTIDDNLVPIARKTMKLVVICFGAIFILENVDIPITPLLAGISIGGLAFALAAQDTIKNLFGSLTIFSDQPFEVGDWIVFSGSEGTVVEVGIRSTKVRTFYDSIISIPNGKLADMKIDNMGRRDYRRFVSKIGLTYDTPPTKVDAFVKGLKLIVHEHPVTRKDYYQIHLNDLGTSSIDVLFYIFFKVPDWTAELEARHQVLNHVINLAKELDIRFAFPTETLFVEEFPDKKSLTPMNDYTNENLEKKLNSFTEKMKNESDKNQAEKK